MNRSHLRSVSLASLVAVLAGSTAHLATAAQSDTDSVLQERVPASVLRSFLPADGEVLSHTLSRDRWPKNKGAFERNETIEIAIGRAIRAKRGDRDEEHAIRHSVVFGTDRVTIRGGWRAHVDAPKHGDYFDGEFTLSADMGFVAGEFQVGIVEMRVQWNASFLAGLLSAVTVGQFSLDSLVEQKLRERLVEAGMETKLRDVVEQTLKRLAAEHGKTVTEISRRTEMRLTRKGLDVQGHLDPTFSVLHVPIGAPMNGYFLPKRKRGDRELGGNGPDVLVELEFRLDGAELQRRVRMRAKETGGDPSLADSATAWEVVHRDERLVGARILGRSKFVLADQVLHGHGMHAFASAFGTVRVHGDTKGDDLDRFTGVRVEFDTKARLPLLLAR